MYTLTLEGNDINILMQLLAQAPYGQVNSLIMKMNQQLEAQDTRNKQQMIPEAKVTK